MTRTSEHSAASHMAHKSTWAERLFVLGGLGLASLFTVLLTAALLIFGAPLCAVGGPLDAILGETAAALWLFGALWAAAAILTLALWRGFRHGDWSAFRRYRRPEDDGDVEEWSSRTGAYTYLRDWEDRHRHGDGHLM